MRTSSGIPGLDQLIEGGLPVDRAILVRGLPGTGKTMFGLQFLVEGLRIGQRGALVSVDEKPDHVIAYAERFDWGLEKAIAGRNLAVLDASPYFTATRRRGWGPSGVDARQLTADLVHQIRAIGAQRLVIDSLTSLVPMEMSRGDAHNYLRSLIQSFEDNFGCTCVLTWRVSSSGDPQGSSDAAEYLTSGILDLNLTPDGRTLARSLVLRKMRGTDFEPAEHALTIDRSRGLEVGTSAPVKGVRELTGVMPPRMARL